MRTEKAKIEGQAADVARENPNLDAASPQNPLNVASAPDLMRLSPGRELNSAALMHSLEIVQESMRDQMQGKTFGKPVQGCELYGFTPHTCQLPEEIRVRLDALYATAGNEVIKSFDAAPHLAPFQDRVVLIVHQMRKGLQDPTTEFLAKHLPDVPAVALISPSFTVDTQGYLDHIKGRDNGGGFVYSNGGRLDYRIDHGESILQPLAFNFRRLDIAGGFVELCQRTALTDSIRIAIQNANKDGKLADLQINYLSPLSYRTYDGFSGGLDLLADDLRSRDSMKAINTTLFLAMKALPEEFKGTMAENWRSGPPYVFESKNGNRVTFTFDEK